MNEGWRDLPLLAETMSRNWLIFHTLAPKSGNRGSERDL